MAILWAAPAEAALFSAYNAAIHERFSSGTTSNPTFLLNGFDLSGVAFDTTPGTIDARGAALISQQHVLGAWHFRPSTVNFVGTDGVVRSYAVESWTRLTTGGINSDVAIGRLASEVTNVNPLPIAIGADSAFIGHELYAFGQSNQAGRNIIDAIGTLYLNGDPSDNPTVVTAYDFDNPSNGGTGGVGDDEIGLVGGDSGYQSLIVSDGQLALLGAHFAVSETPNYEVNYTSFSSFARDYVDQINTIVTGDGQSLSFVVVPEPASMAIFAGAAGLLLARRRR